MYFGDDWFGSVLDCFIGLVSWIVEGIVDFFG